MLNKKLASPAALVLAAATVLGACAQQEEVVVSTNPAADYCVDTGGQYVIRTGKAGDVGVCILPDGQERDAWNYYRENNPA